MFFGQGARCSLESTTDRVVRERCRVPVLPSIVTIDESGLWCSDCIRDRDEQNERPSLSISPA